MLNIDNLTIAQVREIASILNGGILNPSKTESQHPFAGMVCIARCYAAGVHVGFVKSVDGENVILENSYRLWRWSAADGIALSGVAQNGIKPDECKIDTQNPLLYLTGVCELIPCSVKSVESIYGNKA